MDHGRNNYGTDGIRTRAPMNHLVGCPTKWATESNTGDQTGLTVTYPPPPHMIFALEGSFPLTCQFLGLVTTLNVTGWEKLWQSRLGPLKSQVWCSTNWATSICSRLSNWSDCHSCRFKWFSPFKFNIPGSFLWRS